MVLREVDGGLNYYGQFSQSLPVDANYFPIGVWLESVTSQSDIDMDKAIDLNLYVGLTSNSDLSLLQNNGMKAFLQQDEWRTSTAGINSSANAGWLLHDEADMQLGPGAGYTDLNNILAGLPDDGRMHYNNYGKGVMFWESDAEAAQFVNQYQQVTSADTYWFTDPNIHSQWEGGALLNGSTRDLTTSETQLAANYGYTIDRMRYLDGLDGVRQPIYSFVEVGWPFTETAAEGGQQIQPAEIEAAVWQSIIAGARGVIYFNHSFGGPDQTQHVLRDPYYAPERAAVDHTDGLIKQLAPVLNSPFDDGYVSAGSTVREMAKFYEGDHYVFAASTQHAASTPTFTTANSSFSGIAEVVGENRTVTVMGGKFTDNFADGNAWHIYHIDENADVPPPPFISMALVSDTGSSATDGITSDPAVQGSGQPNTAVTVTDGSTVLGTTTADSTGAWSLTPTGLADGPHTFVATQADLAGNTGTTTLDFTLDKTVPTVSMALVSDTGSSATDGITSDPAVQGSGQPNTAVTVTDGSTVLGTTTADSTGAWSLTPTGLADGPHTFVATQADLAGNTGTTTLDFTLDKTVPTVSMALVSDTGSSATDGITSDPAVQGSGQPNTAVTVTDGSTVLGTTTADSTGAWSLTPTGLADGPHTFVATQADLAGNTGTTTLDFTLDSTLESSDLTGTDGNDVLTGTLPGLNVIYGLGGDDTISVTYRSATTEIYGGNGDDTVTGSLRGADYIDGGPGNDLLYGRWGSDTILGGDGDDYINGGAGDDVLYTGSGMDTVQGNNGNDTIYVGPGTNQIDGGPGTDVAIFAGNYADYGLSYAKGITMVAGSDGTSSLSNVETIRFDDGSYNALSGSFL